MMTTSRYTGVCPEQWKKEIDVMLENISGGCEIKQVAYHPTARSIFEPSDVNSLHREHSQTCQESQGDHQ
jgi:hypothetical protein